MTDPNIEPAKEPESTPEPPKDGEPQEPESVPAQTGDELARVRREAAGHRRKLREAEAERDQLAARLSDAQRAEVERQITGPDGLQAASDFWTAGVKLEELRDEQGGLDAEKVKAARDKVLSDHPHWRHQPPTNFDGGAREPAPVDKTPSFGEELKKAATG